MLGNAATRKVDHTANLRSFDPKQNRALFYLTAEVPKEDGTSRMRKLGYVKFSWNTETLTVRVLVQDAERAGVAGIYDKAALMEAAAFDPNHGGVHRFRDEPVEVKVTFGSAVGTRTVLGQGQVQRLLRKVGSAAERNERVFSLDSLIGTGKADTERPARR